MIYQLFNLIFSWFALVRLIFRSHSRTTTRGLSRVMVQGNFYISFVILSESMEDPSFHLGGGVHVLNVILNYVYLGLLVMCFLLSLGNRPQGSKWFYTIAMIGFAVITIYMTVSLTAYLLPSLASLNTGPIPDGSVLPRVQGHRQPREIRWSTDRFRSIHQRHFPKHRDIAARDARLVLHSVPDLCKCRLPHQAFRCTWVVLTQTPSAV